jgi:hypothetical protein
VPSINYPLLTTNSSAGYVYIYIYTCIYTCTRAYLHAPTYIHVFIYIQSSIHSRNNSIRNSTFPFVRRFPEHTTYNNTNTTFMVLNFNIVLQLTFRITYIRYITPIFQTK